MKKILTLVAIVVTLCMPSAKAIDAGTFDELVGFTVIARTHASGELEGVDFDKLVKLDNGMIIEFHSYSYFYAYRPDVVMFSKPVQFQGKSVTLYKVLIEDEDEVLDVTRVR
jgi:hypothetical protein